MHVIDFATLPENELRSPTGKFHSFTRNVSLALGGKANSGSWGGGHPFDFQIRRVPPGAAICPFHSHLAQWELFLIRAGTATIRAGDETHVARPGDVFIHPPGDPHQLLNSGAGDLEVFIFADNPPLDGCYYPDSQKWVLRPPGKVFRMVEADYFDGEDDAPAGASFYKISPASAALPIAPFASRKINVDDLPWEDWRSPKGKFHGTSKELSIALGAKRNTPPGLGGHPFDLEYSRLAPGERGCPFHFHAAQWEMFILLAGTATVRAGAETRVLHANEAVLHPPFEPHDITNTGDADLLFLLVADNPPIDYWHYPESNKWGIREPRKIFRPQEVDYYDGEE
ncbi:MAG TPA: cupin domain-containing protein [Opitutus sp.]|nr:cupin domain-containing protein [Opitutus sp.]